MAKRFIDTEIFQDEWFSDLSKDAKLLWIYIITNCDHAGILKLNYKLIKFQTGIQDIDKSLEELSKSYLRVSKEYLFCFKFIKFQYPNFPQSTVKQQEGAINILKKFGLWDNNLNTYITVTKELEYSYDNDIDNVNVTDNEIMQEIKKEKSPIVLEFEKTFDDYRKMRTSIKKKMTPRAEELIKKDLRKICGDNIQKAIEVLNQSIKNSWIGVFELKETPIKPILEPIRNNRKTL
jgi:hypothetical protein